MTEFTRRNLPADITVFAGTFTSQPLAFAHLLDVAPNLDLAQVEVIQTNHAKRLAAYFDDATAANLPAQDTLILILPTAHEGLDCTVSETTHLRPLGIFRGTIPHLSATQ